MWHRVLSSDDGGGERERERACSLHRRRSEVGPALMPNHTDLRQTCYDDYDEWDGEHVCVFASGERQAHHEL